ncbi:MAG TPA: response regulator [Bacteroidota bacterium]|nr:response regulator [Bacteroidota bacterium]
MTQKETEFSAKSHGRVLLAEDDLRDVELTLEAFREHNLLNEVDVVRDGVEALEYLNAQGKFAGREQRNPVLILLDLKMPRLNGIEVLRAIRSSERLRLIPVMILTSSQESRDLQECYGLGANAYVVKPVDFREFVESVKTAGVFWALINQPPLPG